MKWNTDYCLLETGGFGYAPMHIDSSVCVVGSGVHAGSRTDEWKKKLWYLYAMEYYSAIKRNTSESPLLRWINQEPVIQSEVSQKEKNKYHILTRIYGI